MLDPVLKNPWVRAAAALAALVCAALLAWLLRPVLLPLFFAFLVAYALDPVVDIFERMHVRRSIAIGALVLVGMGLMAAVPLYLLPGVVRESEGLVSIAHDRIAKADPAQGTDRVYAWVQKLPLRRLVDSLGWAPADQPNYDPLAVMADKLGTQVREGSSEILKKYGTDILGAAKRTGSGIAGVFASTGRFALKAVLALGNVALFAFVAGYLLRDYDHIVAAAKELVPPVRRARVFRVMGEIDSQLRGVMRGQALVCLFLGAVYSIGLTIAGVPFGLVLGIFGGLISFVPYLGITCTALTSIVLCLVQHAGADWHLAVVAGTFVVAQTLEATVITPKIVGERVGLAPVWVILAVLVFGNALGLLGVAMALPTAATLKVLVSEALVEYKRSELFVSHKKKR